ncbi:MAG TPA: hypothetical protein V6C72_13450 [Chroococcales cyanobacterium]
MIRLGKPVQLLEWGAGTTTLTQNWNVIGNGTLIAKPKVKMGVTEVAVEVNGPFKKENDKDDAIKLVQQGEGMTPTSDKWGEVAVGRLKSVDAAGGKTIVKIEIKNAVKIGKGV